MFIQNRTRLKDDAALGIVLSVYFGFGIALMGLITRMEAGNAAGLSSFIYGKTASMLFFDAMLIALTAAAVILFCVLFFKEFALICFDAAYGATQGWPVKRLDFLMMTLVVVVTVIGLQAVGIILVVALLIIPASAARFWTYNLRYMLGLSGLFGAISGMLGAGISALMANLPAGAIIVLAASAVFVFSMVFGSARGLLRMVLERARMRRQILREHLLRDAYEWIESTAVLKHRGKESAADSRPGSRPDELLARRAWSSGQFLRTIRRLRADSMLTTDDSGKLHLTESGFQAAKAVVRKHRLWEAYLISHADVATATVDLSADRIEHVLDADIVRELEQLLPDIGAAEPPRSPHALQAVEGA
jgi:manganese/zinc/iron transport system permease protein